MKARKPWGSALVELKLSALDDGSLHAGAADGPHVHAVLTVTFGGLKPVHETRPSEAAENEYPRFAFDA